MFYTVGLLSLSQLQLMHFMLALRSSLPSGEAATVDHLPPPCAEVKNVWSYASNPLICIHGVDRDNFAFDVLTVVLLKSETTHSLHHVT
jgi:hypothetical protein